jgi:F-type H+-transporting ATPase subunit gamma
MWHIKQRWNRSGRRMMEPAEAIKRRINNTEDLLSIVKTMKTLAAINIRQYDKAVKSLADYYRAIEMGFQVLLRNAPEATALREVTHHANLGVIIFGSDQGMCGQFNEQIATLALDELTRLKVSRPHRMILTLGVRLTAHLHAIEQPIEATMPIPGSIGGITPLIQDIVMKIDAWRTERQVQSVILFYNRPVSGAVYSPHVVSLLPVNMERLRRLARREWPSKVLPTFTMDWQQLLSALMHQYLFVSIYRAFAESLMSENASRLATMQSAERSIQDHLDSLYTLFHQERQRAITEELLDIIAGFETFSSESGARPG